jgi:hypothetical protein
VVAGVEEAGDSEGREVHTQEVPEDDVPDEYLDKDWSHAQASTQNQPKITTPNRSSKLFSTLCYGQPRPLTC